MTTGAYTEFTPLAPLFGGVLIGLSTVMVMALFGKIAGISGITRGALGGMGHWPWRLAFIGELVAAPLLVVGVGAEIEQTVPSNLGAVALAGLVVGFGSVWGSGCTGLPPGKWSSLK